MNMTVEKILENLNELVGEEIDFDNVIRAFGDYEEDGESEVYVGKSNNSGYSYIAYINTTDSTQFLIDVDEKNIISDIRIA